MPESIHHIRRQLLEINCFSSEKGREWFARAGDFFDTRISPGIQSVLNEVDQPGRLLKIDKVFLEISIRQGEWEERALADKIMDELRRCLNEIISRRQFSPTVINPAKDIVSEVTPFFNISQQEDCISALFYYLERGYLPWAKSGAQFSNWIHTKKNMLSLSSGAVQKLRSRLYDHADELTRFVQLLPDEIFISFLKILSESAKPNNANTLKEGKWFLNYPFAKFNDSMAVSRSYQQLDRWQKEVDISLAIGIPPPVILKRYFQRLNHAEKLRWKTDTRGLSMLHYPVHEWEKRAPEWKDALERLAEPGDYSSPEPTDREELDVTHRDKKLPEHKAMPKGRQKELEEEVSPYEGGKRSGKNTAQFRRFEAYGSMLPVPGDSIYLQNAGLILTHPFIPNYFQNLELLDAEAQFLDQEAQQKAVLLLHYLLWDDPPSSEEALILNKLLCGLNLQDTIDFHIPISTEEKQEGKKMLEAVIESWPALGGTGIEGLVENFLIREGKLLFADHDWKIYVHRTGVDVLLSRLDWSLTLLRLPFMKHLIFIEW